MKDPPPTSSITLKKRRKKIIIIILRDMWQLTGWLTESHNKSRNYNGVCRIAPDSPGLSKSDKVMLQGPVISHCSVHYIFVFMTMNSCNCTNILKYTTLFRLYWNVFQRNINKKVTMLQTDQIDGLTDWLTEWLNDWLTDWLTIHNTVASTSPTIKNQSRIV